jgi:hypothetical protein
MRWRSQRSRSTGNESGYETSEMDEESTLGGLKPLSQTIKGYIVRQTQPLLFINVLR